MPVMPGTTVPPDIENAPPPPESTLPGARPRVPLTIIIPAYNEAAMIADTVESIRRQTVEVEAVLVVDDGSTDDTGACAAAAGATVLRPPANTGTKAGAQNVALPHVRSRFTMAIDADTTLAPDAIERLMPALEEEGVAAACGFVLPRRVKTLWERGRYLEYLFAFGFYKPIQDYFHHPLIASGCFSAYRTDVLRQLDGWPVRSMTEDMDLTWSLYHRGHGVRFVPEAVCYPLEPHNYHFMHKQLRRWSHGFVQNVRLHWRHLLELPFLRQFVAVAMWDAVFASLVYAVLLPLLALLVSPWFLLGYLIDAPVVMVPVLAAAHQRGETRQALMSLPGFFALRTVNAFFMLEALWSELIARKTLTTYEKGH